MEAAKGLVDEGQAIVAGLEEESIVVAADATIEGSESLRGEFVTDPRFVIDLSYQDD